MEVVIKVNIISAVNLEDSVHVPLADSTVDQILKGDAMYLKGFNNQGISNTQSSALVNHDCKSNQRRLHNIIAELFAMCIKFAETNSRMNLPHHRNKHTINLPLKYIFLNYSSFIIVLFCFKFCVFNFKTVLNKDHRLPKEA